MRAREIMRSTRRVLDGLASFGWSTSYTVVAKAGDLLRRNQRFPRTPFSAIVYPVTSEDGAQIYTPTIVFDDRGFINLEMTHCTCEAGHYGTVLCHHLIAALVHADHLGYRLETT